jgi:hypothetical protein
MLTRFVESIHLILWDLVQLNVLLKKCIKDNPKKYLIKSSFNGVLPLVYVQKNFSKVVVAVIVGNIVEQVVEFVATVEQRFVLFVQSPVIACSSEHRFVLELVGIVEHFAAQFVVIAEQVVGFVEETVVPVEQLAEFVVAYSSLLICIGLQDIWFPCLDLNM